MDFTMDKKIKMEGLKVKELFIGMKGIFITVNGKMINSMVLEYLSLPMAAMFKGILVREKLMDFAVLRSSINIHILDFGIKVFNMV